MARGWSYNDMGASYADIGKVEIAASYFERARTVGKAEGEHRLTAAALGNLGLAYWHLGNARRAIGYYEQSLAMYREMQLACGSEAERTAVRRGEGSILGNLGLAHVQLGDARRAIGYYEQQLTIARQTGDRREEANALDNLGGAFAAIGDTHRATSHYERQLVITREIGDRRGEGNALGNLGGVHVLLGDARRAIDYCKQQLAITQEIGDRRGEGSALVNLGAAHFQLGEAHRAIDYHMQSLAIHRKIGDRRGERQDLSNLGNDYSQFGEPRRAIGYYEQSLEIGDEIGDMAGVAGISFSMALVLANQGEVTRALQMARRAAQIYEQIGHAEYAQRAQGLVVQLQGGGPVGGPPPARILASLGPLIEAAVAGAQGNRQARAALEGAFSGVERAGWRVAEPIRRIWAGERDEARLTAGMSPDNALVVREILKRLRN